MTMLAVARRAFEEFVQEGVEAIPRRFRVLIKNVAFLVDDEPTQKQRRDNKLLRSETLLGLYEGIPRTARGEDYGGLVLPDRITIFKRPIEEAARDSCAENDAVQNARRSNNLRSWIIAMPDIVRRKYLDAVRKIVIETVWHEVAHHFGLPEPEVRRRERRRIRPRGLRPGVCRD